MGAASWATARPGGFTPIEIETLLALVEPFSLLFEIKALDDMLARGPERLCRARPSAANPGGTVRRGDVRLMRAAMMLTDLRGFGELSDRQSPDHVVAALKRMFDAIVPAVEAEGGEVLKYIGDGLLAVFDADRDEAEARRAALRAAEAALDALATLRDGDRAAFEVGVALHVGEVAYGNIGGGDRVDFTAIGRDLNVLARVERLCKTYDTPLIATDTFLHGLAHALEPLGIVAFAVSPSVTPCSGVAGPRLSKHRRSDVETISGTTGAEIQNSQIIALGDRSHRERPLVGIKRIP